MFNPNKVEQRGSHTRSRLKECRKQREHTQGTSASSFCGTPSKPRQRTIKSGLYRLVMNASSGLGAFFFNPILSANFDNGIPHEN
jgi:hypothetical protein